jgi:hypothetical protein
MKEAKSRDILFTVPSEQKVNKREYGNLSLRGSLICLALFSCGWGIAGLSEYLFRLSHTSLSAIEKIRSC